MALLNKISEDKTVESILLVIATKDGGARSELIAGDGADLRRLNELATAVIQQSVEPDAHGVN